MIRQRDAKQLARLLVVVLCGAAAACLPAHITANRTTASVPGTEWQVRSPANEGMDRTTLEQARTYAFGPGMNTQGVVVIRHGVIVAEWYAPGANKDSWAASWSIAKSFNSALIGIAIHEGKIPSVNEPMTTYYPEWKGTPREKIRLKDVLQMSSGLDWNENYGSVTNSQIVAMALNQPDELAYAAGRPPAFAPGTRWNYSSGDAMLMSGVLRRATGMTADAYAAKKLFTPIGLTKVQWWRDAKGHTLTYCCLDTTSRNFARFGLLYLRHGRWGRQQVVPASWIKDSLVPAPASHGSYGYEWWLESYTGVPRDAYAAIGFDGQYIYVIPSLDLVVVRNGTYAKDPGKPIADPNLFGKYPSAGLVRGKGTTPPLNWDPPHFLDPIVASIKQH